MIQNSGETHPELDEILDYFESAPGEETSEREAAEEALERHFAECDECAAIARRVHVSRKLLDAWSLPKRGSLEASNPTLARSLANLIERTASTEWRQRLRVWADKWSGMGEGAVRMVLEGPNRAARIITDGLDDFLRTGALWKFALEPVVLTSVRGRDAADRGKPSKAPNISVAVARGASSARIAITSDVGQVEVRVDDLPPDTKAPLVLLVPTTGEHAAQVMELQCPEGSSHWEAVFEHLQAGEYLVLFEPF
jgi:hypothetical protein